MKPCRTLFWEQVFILIRIEIRIEKKKKMSNNNFVGRIDQIESIDLDHEIEQHFTSQLKKVS